MATTKKSLPSQKSKSMMRLLIVVLIMSFVGIMIWRSNRQATLGTYSNVPQELQINYVPQEFRLNVDEEKVLTILANPQRNRQAFNSLVRQVNLAILDHVGRRMDLTPSQLTQISNEYEKHHPYLRNLYYSDFLALKDTTDLAVQTWYESERSVDERCGGRTKITKTSTSGK